MFFPDASRNYLSLDLNSFKEQKYEMFTYKRTRKDKWTQASLFWLNSLRLLVKDFPFNFPQQPLPKIKKKDKYINLYLSIFIYLYLYLYLYIIKCINIHLCKSLGRNLMRYDFKVLNRQINKLLFVIL